MLFLIGDHTDTAASAVTGEDDCCNWMSLTMFFIHLLMSPMMRRSTKCDDAPLSKVMVDFSGPGAREPARNE